MKFGLHGTPPLMSCESGSSTWTGTLPDASRIETIKRTIRFGGFGLRPRASAEIMSVRPKVIVSVLDHQRQRTAPRWTEN